MRGRRLRVLMCCSDIRTFKGGMVTVVKNYLESEEWKDCFIRFVPTHNEGTRAEKAACFLAAYLRIVLLLIRRQVDVAHLHMAERGSFYRKAFIAQLCRCFRVPVILHHHGAEFEEFYASLSDRGKRYVRRIFEQADLNLVLSRRAAVQCRKKAPGARIRVLYNAVRLPWQNPYSREAKNLLVLGRLGKRKGTDVLLRTLKRIDAQLPEGMFCCLCGDGEVQRTQAMVRRLGLEHRIAHIGWVEADEKERLLKNTAIHILPSYREGLPMSILETMARGIPNISSNIAAIPEAITDGENGYLTEPGDEKTLADRILRLAKDAELRERFSGAAYARVRETFNQKDQIKALERYYHRAVRGKYRTL